MLTVITRCDGYLARQQLCTAFVRFSFGDLSALIELEAFGESMRISGPSRNQVFKWSASSWAPCALLATSAILASSFRI